MLLLLLLGEKWASHHNNVQNAHSAAAASLKFAFNSASFDARRSRRTTPELIFNSNFFLFLFNFEKGVTSAVQCSAVGLSYRIRPTIN